MEWEQKVSESDTMHSDTGFKKQQPSSQLFLTQSFSLGAFHRGDKKSMKEFLTLL